MDEFKLWGGTLKKDNKEVDEEEEMLYAELYKNLEKTDQHISCSRHGQSSNSGEGMSKGKGKGKAKNKGKNMGSDATSMQLESSSGLATTSETDDVIHKIPPIERL